MNGKQYSIAIAAGMGACREVDQHFDTLPRIMKTAVEAHIESRGYSFEELRTSYSLRDHFNISYYESLGHLAVDRFNAKLVIEQTLF